MVGGLAPASASYTCPPPQFWVPFSFLRFQVGIFPRLLFLMLGMIHCMVGTMEVVCNPGRFCHEHGSDR